MTFGLLEFNDLNKFEEFKRYIIENLNNNKYKCTNDNKFIDNSLNFINKDNINICELIIKKTKIPYWSNNILYSYTNNIKDIENIKYFRIVLIQINNNNYYFEINGEINMTDILNKFEFTKIDCDLWNHLDKNITFLEKIKQYILNIATYDLIQEMKIINSDIQLPLFIDKNLNYYLDKYNNINDLEINKKLKPYILSECQQINTKSDNIKQTISSENKYNSNICSDDKYINMDCKKIDGIEIADIYDKENDLFFHNKKISDLRTLAAQIINGHLYIQDNNKFTKYKKTNEINIDNANNYGFVAGIICCSSKNKLKTNINTKDQIMLGIVSDILEQKNIKFYKDIINYVDDIKLI